jgi:hypothetical protein
MDIGGIEVVKMSKFDNREPVKIGERLSLESGGNASKSGKDSYACDVSLIEIQKFSYGAGKFESPS